MRPEPIVTRRCGVVKPVEPTAEQTLIAQLRTENAQLRAENARLTEREHTIANQAQKAINNAEILRHENISLAGFRADLDAEVLKLETRVHDLEGALGDAQLLASVPHQQLRVLIRQLLTHRESIRFEYECFCGGSRHTHERRLEQLNENSKQQVDAVVDLAIERLVKHCGRFKLVCQHCDQSILNHATDCPDGDVQ